MNVVLGKSSAKESLFAGILAKARTQWKLLGKERKLHLKTHLY